MDFYGLPGIPFTLVHRKDHIALNRKLRLALLEFAQRKSNRTKPQEDHRGWLWYRVPRCAGHFNDSSVLPSVSVIVIPVAAVTHQGMVLSTGIIRFARIPVGVVGFFTTTSGIPELLCVNLCDQ